MYICTQIDKELRRKSNIAFVVLSVVIVLIAQFIPHHHHEGVVCVVQEQCLIDNTYNDEHTQHRESSTDCGVSCFENSLYLHSNSEQNNSFLKDDFNPNLLFPILISQSNFLSNPYLGVDGKFRYGEQIIIYKSAETISSNGLRAPPYILA